MLQSVLLFRGFGVGRLWAAGTAMGGVIGLGQVSFSGRIRLAPHILVCAGALSLWLLLRWDAAAQARR